MTFALVVMAMLLLAACAPAAQTPAAAPATDSDAPATTAMRGPLFYNSNQSDPLPRQADEAMVAAFQEVSGIQVEHSTVGHEDFKQAIRTYLISDNPPDVLTWFAGNRARFFIDRGLIMDISDVWEEQGWNESYPRGLQALSTVDGKQYFVPSNYYWWAIYYRPSLYEEAGITSVPETWDELLAACDALNDAGYIPFAIGTRFRWTTAAWFDYLNMRINGPEFHINLMLGTESYADPRVVEVFEHWRQLFDHDCFLDNAAAYDWQDALDFMIQGEAASYLMGAFVTDSYPDEMESDLDFFRFPIINPDVPIGEDAPTDGYFAAAGAANPELAKEMLAYIGGVENQRMMFEMTGRLAANSDVDKSIYDEVTQKGIALIEGADYVAQFYDRDTTPEMADRGMNVFMSFWANPQQDLVAMLEALDAERIRIFAEADQDE
jgi:multiple sugar transport system substrate-binding protein/raffinose/stachyose/melibiose transport system substrate-binding protein